MAQNDKLTTVRLDELKKHCTEKLVCNGASDEVALLVYSDYLEAEARGRASHGFMSFDVALSAFPVKGHAEVVDHRGSLLTIEGNGDTGHWAARFGIDSALSHFDENGASVIGVRNISRFNTPGPIARYGAERGAVTLVFEYGGANFMAPEGGSTAALSTNPIGIAFPGTDPLFVLDIATSERAWGYVALAKLEGTSIPGSWGLDSGGSSTTDPAAVATLRAFGGHKGFGLALAAEILSGALVGVPIGSKGSLPVRGALIILIKPDAFGVTQRAFQSRVRSFLKEVTGVPPAGDTPVRYPGQESSRRYHDVLAKGEIELPTSVWRKLLDDTRQEV